MSDKVTALPPQNFSAESLPMRGPVERVSMTPMDILGRAVASGATIDVIERLMALAERWESSQNRKAFEEAVAAAGKEIPVIVKNATGHNQKKYANFAAIAKAVDPILGQHGLYYRFRTTQGETISVTCVLYGHGHSEETTLSAPPDKSGNKSDIHALGSTLTYLQRYSLVQMLGLAAAEDDDGHAASMGDVITDEMLQKLESLAYEVSADMDAFCRLLKVESLHQLPQKQYPSALALLKTKQKKVEDSQ